MTHIIIKDIHIEVIKKKVKNMNLSIHSPDGRVRISVPKSMEDEVIKNFLISKLPWIKSQRAKYELQEIPPPKEYITGETHYYLGSEYLLNVVETSGKQYAELDDNHINLYVRPNSTVESRNKIMTEWYRERLKGLIPEYIEKWEPIIGVKVEDWGVRLMKTRWGSCNIQAKRIWINLEFSKKAPIFLDYIIVHEMVHLLERNHNKKFKSYMDKFLPNWKNIKAKLNGLNYGIDN